MLALLAVRALLALLLALLTLHLLHLALQLFRLATEHLLLPAFLEVLRLVALLLREFLLPLGERVELRQRVIHLLLLLLRGRSRLCGLVLVLLRVHL